AVSQSISSSDSTPSGWLCRFVKGARASELRHVGPWVNCSGSAGLGMWAILGSLPIMDLSVYPPNAALDDGRLILGGCRVAEVAEEFGTPAYLIDAAGLRARAVAFQEALTSRHPHSQVLFASKSFPTPSVMGLIADTGCGLDVAALGELLAAER